MFFRQILIFAIFIIAFSNASGAVSIDINSKEIKDYVEKVLTKYNGDSQDDHYYVSVKIETATKETVPGVTYYIKLKIGPSNCHKIHILEHCFDPTICKISTNDINSIKEINAKIYIAAVDGVEEITFQ